MKKHHFFNQLACEKRPFEFSPEELKKLDVLRGRLGDLQGLHILEPGCGSGALTPFLLDWVGPAGGVTSFDMCEKMLEHARHRVQKFTNVHVMHADAARCSFLAHEFDLIICFRFFPHVDDKIHFLKTCRNWLKPTGTLVVANLEGSTRLNQYHAMRHTAVAADVMPDLSNMQALFQQTGWAMQDGIDDADEYFVSASMVE